MEGTTKVVWTRTKFNCPFCGKSRLFIRGQRTDMMHCGNKGCRIFNANSGEGYPTYSIAEKAFMSGKKGEAKELLEMYRGAGDAESITREWENPRKISEKERERELTEMSRGIREAKDVDIRDIEKRAEELAGKTVEIRKEREKVLERAREIAEKKEKEAEKVRKRARKKAKELVGK